MGALRVILGDQLNTQISSLSDCDKERDIILMCEVRDEATSVKHHKKKIAFLFSAMRHFAGEIHERGYSVRYVHLDDDDNTGSFTGEVERAIADHDPSCVVVTHPGEYRVLKEIESWSDRFEIDVEIREDDRFLCSIDEFKAWASGRKEYRMEYFYREMRTRYDVLMTHGKPEGGQWNYDAENRKVPKEGLVIPAPYQGQVDNTTKDVMALVAEHFESHFGDLEPFCFAVTRDQALYALRVFIEKRLPYFGDYQDAMIQGEPWMYHSHLSFYLNCGLLLPMDCIRAAEEAYHNGEAPLNAVEGFIRQILGWREYVRGIYWLGMPEYAEKNALNASRDVPWFFWTGETQMNCMRQVILETKENAYAHHIQRLMVVGNFALLCGLDPEQVNEWYLIVYADAYEWVELPNVSGMILYADGGMLSSKPYAAGGNYINKMSDYCAGCTYRPTVKNGPKACPFNYLYWDFLARHRQALEGNHRLGMMYKTLDRMSEEKKQAIADDAKQFLKEL